MFSLLLFWEFTLNISTIAKNDLLCSAVKIIKVQAISRTTKRLRFLYSVQFSHSVVSDYLQPQGLQNTRLLCPSPTLELAQTNVYQVGDAIQPSHPLSSPSPVFNLFPALGSFQMNQFFTSDDQNVGLSTSASVLPINIQD